MKTDDKICQFRVFLEEIEPKIWRRLLIPGGFTLANMHTIIQVAMPWKDYHLHEFSLGELRYGRPDYDEGKELLDERRSAYAISISRLAIESLMPMTSAMVGNTCSSWKRTNLRMMN